MINRSRRIRKKRNWKNQKESFLQKNIRLGMFELKNLHHRLLDNEIVECDSPIDNQKSQNYLISENVENGINLNGINEDIKIPDGFKMKNNQLECGSKNQKSIVKPNWEILNLNFQNSEVMEQIYSKIKKQSTQENQSSVNHLKSTLGNHEISQKLREDFSLDSREELYDNLISGITNILDRVKNEKADFLKKNSQNNKLIMTPESLRESNKTTIKKLTNQFKKKFLESPKLSNENERTKTNLSEEISNVIQDLNQIQKNNLSLSKNETPKTKSQSMLPTPSKTLEKKPQILKSKSFLNCDVNYFNFEFLSKKIGGFDIILMDPPWRIKGGQKNDSQFMFANNRFCLEYDTMSNEQIASLNIGTLSEKGFMFLWILGNQIKSACEMLSKWGYDLVDIIVWVKTKNGRVYLSHGYYLMHSFEICLVGYKCPSRKRVEYFSKVSNNIIFADVRSKSQKPDELYEIIELMMPGAKRLEIFARNNNLRHGWFSIGNQLGEEYLKWNNHVSCDGCALTIPIGTPRFKSKLRANFDLCSKCYSSLIKRNCDGLAICENKKLLMNGHSRQNQIINNQKFEMILLSSTPNYINLRRVNSIDPSKKLQIKNSEKFEHRIEKSANDFFRIENKVTEAVLHKYYSCDGCGMSPIWGLRFSCKNCPNLDLCEGCYDLCQETGPKSQALFSKLKFHSPTHSCEIHELQEHSYGYQTHLSERCASCYQKPIIGLCFKCKKCSNLSLCQKCFFQDRGLEVPHRKTHLAEHSWDIMIRPKNKGMKNLDCSWCESGDVKAQYSCNICHEFYLCSVCYMKKDYFVTNKASTHKVFHTFSKITDGYVQVTKK